LNAQCQSPAPVHDPGNLVLQGIRTPTLNDLVATIETHCVDDLWAVADLSLGAWKSYSVACEFASQLGLAHSQETVMPALDSDSRNSMPSYADIIGQGIDAEASGNRSILKAVRLARQCVTAMTAKSPFTFIVLVPRFGMSWEPEDVAFINLLVRELQGNGRVLLITTESFDPPIPDGWRVEWHTPPVLSSAAIPDSLLGLVPGVVAPTVLAAISGENSTATTMTLLLRDGSRLVAPECRRSPLTVPRLDYDRFATLVQQFGYLEAYAQCFGNNIYVEPSFLCSQAWQCFAEGGTGIALRLLDRAAECAATPTQWASIKSQAQGMRIACWRFLDVAKEVDPSPSVPTALHTFLLKAKGWGLAMSDDVTQAETYLVRARALWVPKSGDREYFYLLNVSALCRFKSGDFQGALKLEKEIEEGTHMFSRPDWRLVYVNSINQARLYRQLGDLDAAERYYDKAFATTLGTRSESDAIYSNVCRAWLEGQRGRFDAAFLCWVRAALHWVSSLTPEAVNLRVIRSILGYHVSSFGIDLVEQVSSALLQQLMAGEHAVGAVLLDSSIDVERCPYFIRHEELEQRVYNAIVGGRGWSVLLTTAALPKERYWGSCHQNLRTWLWRWIQMQGASFEDETAVVVDDCCGREVATNAAELLQTCIRTGTKRMHFESSMVELTTDLQQALTRAAVVTLGPAIDCTEPWGALKSVTFKRFLPRRVLSAEEYCIVELAENCLTIEELTNECGRMMSPARAVELLRCLEHSRIVLIKLSEGACTTAGIRLHLNATSVNS